MPIIKNNDEEIIDADLHLSDIFDNDRSLGESNDRIYPTTMYTSYVGKTTVNSQIAFYASSTAMNENYIVVGAPGYDNFRGQVIIYKPVDLFRYSEITTLSIPPVGSLGSYVFGFGQKVAISSDNVIAIGAGI